MTCPPLKKGAKASAASAAAGPGRRCPAQCKIRKVAPGFQLAAIPRREGRSAASILNAHFAPAITEQKEEVALPFRRR